MTYPANHSLNQQIRRVLYALKRQYGGAIVVYQNGVVTTDTKTGEVARTKTATRIHRAIVLPVTVSREVKQSISLISANKQMVTGGGFESGKRLFIVERRDCPSLVLHKTRLAGLQRPEVRHRQLRRVRVRCGVHHHRQGNAGRVPGRGRVDG